MPFTRDTAWPRGLLAIFERARARATTFEDRYYGPYDKLLNYCFGQSFKFYVAPQCPPRDGRCESADFVVSFVVCDASGKPVLLVEVKDDSWAQKAELRYRADKQMRERLSLLLDECPLPRLWGLSLLGTSPRFYCADGVSYDVFPHALDRPDQSRVLSPTFLAGEWGTDILSEKGFAAVKDVVTDILTLAGQL